MKNIALNDCCHENSIELLKKEIKNMNYRMQCGPRQLVCTISNCFNIIDDNHLMKLLGKTKYKDFIENFEVHIIRFQILMCALSVGAMS